MTSALRKLIAEAEGLGWTFEPAHEQFFHLRGSGKMRDYAIFLNNKGGMASALLYRGENCLGEVKTLAFLRKDLAREVEQFTPKPAPRLAVVR